MTEPKRARRSFGLLVVLHTGHREGLGADGARGRSRRTELEIAVGQLAPQIGRRAQLGILEVHPRVLRAG